MADGRPTLLGKSIADLFIVASLSGESYHYCFTLRGITVSWPYSSAEPTLVPWWTEQLVQFGPFLLPQLLWEKVPVEVLDDCQFDKSSSGRPVTRCRDIVVRFDP